MALKLENVSKTYTRNGLDVLALQEGSCSIEPGQFIAVCGPSGCGKSTLLQVSGGLMRPDAGTVTLDDQDIYALSADERAGFRGASLGFVFQQFHLVPYLNVLENVLVASLALPAKSPASQRDARDRGLALIDRFGLRDRAFHRAAQLSTGERQRVALARALLNEPRFILADEPTGNLDEANGEEVLRHLAECAEQGTGVLLVTHDARAAEVASRVVEMEAGSIRDEAMPWGVA
ncbi:MAG: ABC transporter ATP-binding protein [Pirellulales bacterium]|nr:ABC transporter ATP-binding protein [Pirellulales bacterium]